jgi:hypothetical protein
MQALDILPSFAVSAHFHSWELAHEKRKTAFLDDSRCANLEVTRSEKDRRGQNCKEAEAQRGRYPSKGV